MAPDGSDAVVHALPANYAPNALLADGTIVYWTSSATGNVLNRLAPDGRTEAVLAPPFNEVARSADGRWLLYNQYIAGYTRQGRMGVTDLHLVSLDHASPAVELMPDWADVHDQTFTDDSAFALWSDQGIGHARALDGSDVVRDFRDLAMTRLVPAGGRRILVCRLARTDGCDLDAIDLAAAGSDGTRVADGISGADFFVTPDGHEVVLLQDGRLYRLALP
jgi:hypothetical protein